MKHMAIRERPYLTWPSRFLFLVLPALPFRPVAESGADGPHGMSFTRGPYGPHMDSWPDTLASEACEVGPTAVGPDGTLVVALQSSTRDPGACSLWSLLLEDRQRYGANRQGVVGHVESELVFSEVTSMTSSNDGVFVGTDKGLLRVGLGKARICGPAMTYVMGSLQQTQEGWPGGVLKVAADADGWVWVSAHRPFMSPLCLFPASGQDAKPTGHLLYFGGAPLDLSASSKARGAWVFLRGSRLVHLPPALHSARGDAQHPYPPSSLDRGGMLRDSPRLSLSRV